MRPLPLLVFAESVCLFVLALFWLNPAPAAPGPGAARGAMESPVSPTVPAVPAGVGAAAPAEAGARDANLRTEATDAGTPGTGASIVVHGRVTGPDGEPVTDASVGFRRRSVWRSGTVIAEHFAVAGLAPGPWRATARADGHVTQEIEVALSGEPLQALDFVMQKAHRVRVFLRTLDGGSLEEAVARGRFMRGLHVVATAQPLVGDLPLTENSSVGDIGVGRYRSNRDLNQKQPADAPDGELQLDRPPPASAALLLRHMVLDQQPIAVGQEELTFVLDPQVMLGRLATVRYRVIDALTGQPIAALGRLQSAQGGGGMGKADESGVVVVKGVVPGLNEIHISAKDHEQVQVTVRVPPGADLDLGDFRLHPALKLRGTVRDQDGRPVSGSVQWTDLDAMAFPQKLIDNRSSIVDGDGDFALWGAGPHRFVVIAHTQDGRIGNAVIDARSGEPKPCEIRVSTPVEVAVTVTGDPLRGCVLTLRDGAGVPVAARRMEARWREFTFRVPPGDYVLEVHDDRDQLVQKRPVHASGASVTVEVP